jgi:hypothetical protein
VIATPHEQQDPAENTDQRNSRQEEFRTEPAGQEQQQADGEEKQAGNACRRSQAKYNASGTTKKP